MTRTKRQQHFSFGELPPERRREIASLGAQAQHAKHPARRYATKDEAKAALEAGDYAGLYFEQAYRQCARGGCACRHGGPKHGPYWYATYRDTARRFHSLYVGKVRPGAPESEAT